MDQVRRHLREAWAGSRTFRIILTVALLYAVLRLVVHGAYLGMMLYPNSGLMGGMPGWTGAEGEPMVPVDLQTYVDAAGRLLSQENLYPQGPIDRLEGLYQYTPAFALASVPFLSMSPVSLSVLHTLIHIGAYGWLYLAWGQIFSDLGLSEAARSLALTLPVWLVFSAFWSDLGYLNVYVPVALLSTLLTRAVLREHLAGSVLWLSLILQIKPQWAFPALVPVLLGRYRFFLKLVGLSVAAYGVFVGMTMVVAGPAYVAQQYAEYVQFLWTLPARFPWRGPEAQFLGYNHSVKQVIVYAMGNSTRAQVVATMVKLVLLTPLAIVVGRYMIRTLRGWRFDRSTQALDLAFALYLGAFVWLDMVWELTLGIAIFSYLVAVLDEPAATALVWVVFLPYALIDLWQLVSFAAFGMDVIAPGPYVLTDPSIYFPVVMIVIVAFYAFLLKRAWEAFPRRMTVGAAA